MSDRAFIDPARSAFVALVAMLTGCAAVAPQSAARAVVESKFAAVNRHAVDDVEKLYAPFASITAPNFCAPRHGREDVRRIYQDLFTMFPDLHVEIQEYLVQGDRVAVRYLVHTGPAGKGFIVPIFNLFTVRDGLITTDDGMYDNGGRKCSP